MPANTVLVVDTSLPVRVLDGKEYLEDATGSLVPREAVKEIDQLRTELVLEKAAKIIAAHNALATLKAELVQDVEAFINLSAERYGVTLGGRKGNLKLPTFDGAMRLERQVSDYVTFDEGIQAAKALIDQCFREWTKDSGSEIRAVIDHAFRVDKKGRINTAAILNLRNLKIENENWQKAMDAISESLTIAGSRAYIRLQVRNADGDYKTIPLDIAAL